jgi:hypothetical protein
MQFGGSGTDQLDLTAFESFYRPTGSFTSYTIYEFRSNSAKAVSYRSNTLTTWSIALLFTKLANPSIP